MRRLPRLSVALLIAYALALLVLSDSRRGFENPNEMSRLDLLESIVRDATLAIDAAIARNGDLEDKLVVDGRTYANKPPGLALLALPGYAAAHALARLAGSPLGPVAGIYAARLLAVSLPCLVFLAAFARRLRAEGLDERSQAALLAALAFGTGLLPYGAALMSHATTAALLGLAGLRLLASSRRAAFAVALLCGTAASCEYTAAVPGGVLVLMAIAREHAAAPGDANERARGSLLRGAAGAALGLLPAALVVFAYNTAVFGSPFDLGYGHHVDPQFAAVHAGGLGGFHLPSPRALLGLLVSRGQGLFVWSPFLLLALPGAHRAWREGRRLEVAALVLAVASAILLIAAYPNWRGGWTAGPRYLVAVVPLLALLAIPAVRGRTAGLLPGLGAAGIALHGLAVLTWPWLPDLLTSPARDLALFLARSGHFAPTAPAALGLPYALGTALLLLLLALALAATFRPSPLAGAVVLLVALAPHVTAGSGPITFARAEALFRRGERSASCPLFARVLRDEQPSPALRALAEARLAQMACALGEGDAR